MEDRMVSPMGTYVAFVLDKSGSMNKIKDIIVSGFNEHVQTLISEGEKGGNTYASLVLFDGRVHPEFFNAPVNSLRELTSEAYVPNGSTAMYDAVGYTLDRLMRETNADDPNNSYLVIIMSDGEENASKTFRAEQIAEKVQELQKTDRWTFTYVGCNQDLAAVQKSLGIDASNVYKGWTGDDQTSLQQMASGNSSLDLYLGDRKRGMKAKKNFYGQS